MPKYDEGRKNLSSFFVVNVALSSLHQTKMEIKRFGTRFKSTLQMLYDPSWKS